MKKDRVLIHYEIAAVINKVLETHGYKIKWELSEFEDYLAIEPSKEYQFDFISRGVGNPDRISGINKNALGGCDTLPPNDEFRLKKGTYLKLGKFLKAVFGISDTAKIANALVKALVTLPEKFFLLGRPTKIYNLPHKDSGSLGSSCMRDKEPEFFRLYDDLNCKVLYRTEDDLLVFRALLWDDVYILNRKNETVLYKGPFLDRPYSISENLDAKAVLWAKKHKTAYRDFNHDYIVYLPDGKQYNHDDIIIIKPISFEVRQRYTAAPYVDTLSYLYDGDVFNVTNSHNYVLCNLSFSSMITSLLNTDGMDDYLVEGMCCYHCDARLDRENVYYGLDDEPCCESCFYEHYFYCEHCDQLSYYNESVHVEGYGVVCVDCLSNFYYCEECGRYFDKIIEYEENFYCEDCFRLKFPEIKYCKKCFKILDADNSNTCYIKVYGLVIDIYYCKDCFNQDDFIYYDDKYMTTPYFLENYGVNLFLNKQYEVLKQFNCFNTYLIDYVVKKITDDYNTRYSLTRVLRAYFYMLSKNETDFLWEINQVQFPIDVVVNKEYYSFIENVLTEVLAYFDKIKKEIEEINSENELEEIISDFIDEHNN